MTRRDFAATLAASAFAATPPDDVFFATITELGTRLKKNDFSVVELTRAFAGRIEKLGPRYNALALPLTEIAGRRAKAVDDELRRERFRGPLQGIPFGAKDLLAFPGQPTTWGSKAFAAQVLDETATVLKKLDNTGAVLIGKLSMPELGAETPASLFGPALNPWDRTRWSGGSGAALAAGLVPFEIGSETNGSIITSAAYCGVTGLRPTNGLVSRQGAMERSKTMDTIGPICRTAEDCGLVLHVIAGGGDAGKSFYYTPQYARKLTDLKAAFIDFDNADAFRVIRETGIRITEAKLPDYPYEALTATIIGAEAASVFEPGNNTISATEYLRAQRTRTAIVRAFRELFANVDVLIGPSRKTVAPKISGPIEPPGPLIQAGNLAGFPALSLPCGFADNMPLGMQLVGPPFSENTLLALARDFQNRTEWHKRHPAV